LRAVISSPVARVTLKPPSMIRAALASASISSTVE